MVSERKQRFIVTFLIAIVIGLISGAAGSVVARVYLLERSFNVPLVGEIDYSRDTNGSSLVIQGAKKVVVEQNTKIIETADSVKRNIVGIFKAKPLPADGSQNNKEATSSKIDINQLYLINNELGQGLVLTTDGWLITSFVPEEINPGAKTVLSTSTREKIMEKYVVINSEREVFEVTNVVWDQASGYSFWRINANDLPVRRLVSDEEIKNGELLLAANWDGWVRLSSLAGRESSGDDLVASSDDFSSEYILDDNLSKEFRGAFIFNLNGDAAALIDNSGRVLPVSNYFSCIKCLLEKRDITRPSLGIYSSHLPYLVDMDPDEQMTGALIVENETGVAVVKGSPADKAGLAAGDIILSVDGEEIKNSTTLSRIINRYKPGDEIEISYIRAGESKAVKVELGKFE
jgi:hypothetical protein